MPSPYLLAEAFASAFRLIAGLDPDFTEIVARSLKVSLGAVALAALIGLPPVVVGRR